MKNLFLIIQIILSILLVFLIFMQATGESERNSNLLAQTGNEKRGWEKFLFNLTIFLLILFIISSIIQVLI